MQRVYIEPADEVTTVIARIKSSKQDAIVLEVPRGALLLQSLVNLKLVAKAARDTNKTLRLVTTDKIGKNLSNQVGIPVYATIEAAENDEPEQSTEAEPKMIAGVKVRRYYEETDQDPELTPTPTDQPKPIIPKTILAKALSAIAPAAPIQEEVVVEIELEPEEEELPASSFSSKPITEDVITTLTPKKANNSDQQEESAPSVIPALAAAVVAGKSPAKPGNRKKTALILCTVAILILTGTAAAYALPITTVSITVPAKEWTQTFTYAAAPGGALPAELLSQSANDTVTFKATGTKDVGSKAAGDAQIVNDYSTNPQSLPAGAVLSAGGITFVTQKDIIVPGFTAPDGDKIPGKVTVPVVAENSGEGGNVSNQSATITSPVTKIYGKIVSTTGGSTKQVAVISADDISKARQDLIKKLQDQVTGKLLAASPEDQFFFDKTKDTFNLDGVTASAAAGAEQADGTITGSATAKRLVVRRSEVETAVHRDATAPEGTTLSLTQTTLTTSSFSTTESKATIGIEAKGTTFKTVDTSAVAKALIGRTHSDTPAVVQQQVADAGTTITANPSWWPITRIPWYPKSLTVSVKND